MTQGMLRVGGDRDECFFDAAHDLVAQSVFDRTRYPPRALRLDALAIVFVVARFYETKHPWLGYIRAFAEAAMIGGIADWFAVTALFRHPMGIPIPHTAIVPARKDRIGTALGNFVQRNFLTRDVVTAKLAAMKLGERAATWLAQPENSRKLSRHVARG